MLSVGSDISETTFVFHCINCSSVNLYIPYLHKVFGQLHSLPYWSQNLNKFIFTTCLCAKNCYMTCNQCRTWTDAAACGDVAASYLGLHCLLRPVGPTHNNEIKKSAGLIYRICVARTVKKKVYLSEYLGQNRYMNINEYPCICCIYEYW